MFFIVKNYIQDIFLTCKYLL